DLPAPAACLATKADYANGVDTAVGVGRVRHVGLVDLQRPLAADRLVGDGREAKFTTAVIVEAAPAAELDFGARPALAVLQGGNLIVAQMALEMFTGEAQQLANGLAIFQP